MRAGQLRHRVTIERRTEVDDGAGGSVETWATFATVWAAVIPLTGRELFAAQQVASTVSHRIEMRYLAGVLAGTMRAKHETRVLNIRTVMNIDERDRETHLLCEEQKPASD